MERIGSPRAFDPRAVIRDGLVYFDTVCVWIPRYLEAWERDTLESLCACLIYLPTWRSANPWMWRLGYRVRLLFQQPTKEALQFLEQRFSGCKVPLTNRVDCALDFVTSTRDHARELQLYFDARWYKPYHRAAHEVEVYARETTYIGFKHWPSKYVTYSDRPSRHVDRPCCHLECRFQSKRAVTALGIESIDDLLAFDHLTFWKKRLRLYEYDLEDLGKRWNGRHLNCAPRIVRSGSWTRNLDQWTGNVITRALITQEEADKPILMDLLASGARWGRSLSRVLVPVDVTDLLATVRSADT